MSIGWDYNSIEFVLSTGFLDITASKEDKIRVAECIYDTDRYIYPIAFGENRKKAVAAISKLLGKDNSLFDLGNFYVARNNKDICGICLLSHGTHNWDVQNCLSFIKDDIDSVQDFEYASEEYFFPTAKGFVPGEIEIVACCVAPQYRRKGIAGYMLDHLFKELVVKDQIIRLCVLADNYNAIELYKDHGFVITDHYKGFNRVELQAPDVYSMKRQQIVQIKEKI